MNHEIKDDNNCIMKAFENHPISIISEQIDEKKVYCFKASDIAKALGIVNIHSTIQNYDEDERVIRKAYDPQGNLQNTVFLTSHGVYRVLNNSKKPEAKKFRKWAGNILDDIIFNDSKDLKRQLDEKEKIINDQDQKLKKLTRVINHKVNEIVYVFECKYKDEIIYKIGRTKNGNRRESELITGNINGEIIFTLNCLNNNLIEKLVHQLLDNYRISIDREWFNCDLETIINTLNYSKLVTEDIIKDGVTSDIKNLFKLFKSHITRTDNIKPIKREIDIQKDIILNITPYKTNKLDDYEAFLNDLFDITNQEIDYISVKELKAVYTIWAHDNEYKNWKNVEKYFTEKFTIIKHKLENMHRIKKECFQGLKFKNSIYNFNQNNEDNEDNEDRLDVFLFEKCKKGPFFQIAHNELYYEYEKYMIEIYPEYIFTTLEQTKLDNYCNITFLRTKVGTVVNKKDNRIYGWRGVSLKSNIKNIDYKVLPNKLNSKKVFQYNLENILIKTFDSQRDVAFHLKISPGAVNTNIKKNKLMIDPLTGLQYYFKNN
jgi:prophage antirepressor-like protein